MQSCCHELHPEGIQAQYHKRVLRIVVETCQACGGAVRIMPKVLATLVGQALAGIEDLAMTGKIPVHVGKAKPGRAVAGTACVA